MLDGADLSNSTGPALTADGISVGQDMLCRDGFSTTGELRLLSAHIGGQLILDGASLTHENEPALHADGLVVEDSMSCQARCTIRGELRLVSAHIGGTLDLSDADISNEGSQAFSGDRLIVEQSMICRGTFVAKGEVRLINARIGLQLDLDGANLINDNGRALDAEGLVVGHSMFCRNGFAARGQVVLGRARVGAQLNFHNGNLTAPVTPVLDLEHAEVESLWLTTSGPPAGGVNLASATVGELRDSQASWPSSLSLDGFTYSRLESSPRLGVKARLAWLRLGGFLPRPYEQLANYYRRIGEPDAARKVAITKQWRSLRATRNPVLKLWNLLLYIVVGYGYRPWLAGVWLALLLARRIGPGSPNRSAVSLSCG